MGVQVPLPLHMNKKLKLASSLIDRIDKLAKDAKLFKEALAELKLEGGREVSLVVTKLEEASMWMSNATRFLCEDEEGSDGEDIVPDDEDIWEDELMDDNDDGDDEDA